MNILLTTGFLARHTGSEIVIRDLALALAARRHRVAVFSPRPGDVTDIGGVPVVADLDGLGEAPDLIHGQHATSILPAWRRFPGVPMIQSIQDVSHPLDEPLPLPSIRHYIAVDEVRARRVRDAGVPEERITLVPNAVALDRFPPKPPHARIARGLLVAKYHEGFGDIVRRALGPRGVTVDVVGAGGGGMRSDFAERLGDYDLLVGSGRCVLEAAAVGLSAIVCDERGFAGPLTLESWPRLRDGNFGMAVLAQPTTPHRLGQALEALDPSEAPRLRDLARGEAPLGPIVDRIEELYRRVVAEHAGIEAPSPADAPLVDYALRLHEHCIRNMVVRDLAKGRLSVAQLVEREKARELDAELRRLRQQSASQERQLAEAQRHLLAVQRSLSWRITRPLRGALRAVNRLKRSG